MEGNKDIKEGIANILKQDKTYEIMKRIVESLEQNGKLLSQVLPQDDEDRTVAEGIEIDIIKTYVDQYIQKGELYSEKIKSKNPDIAALAHEMEMKRLNSKTLEVYNNELKDLEKQADKLRGNEKTKETNGEG